MRKVPLRKFYIPTPAIFVLLINFHISLLNSRAISRSNAEQNCSSVNCFRLSDDLLPIVYSLKLTLDSESATYSSGQIQIEILCQASANQIQLHANPAFLSVDQAILDDRLHNESYFLEQPSINWESQVVTFQVASKLRKSFVYYLNIWFTAKYSTDGRGLSRHFDKEHGLWLNTLLEPVHARKVFLCFDEPRFRAQFKLELWLQNQFAQEDFMALSNTNGEVKRWNENLTIWTFDLTPPIPSYLFTIAVGRFQKVCNDSAVKRLDQEICIWRFTCWDGQWEQIARSMLVICKENYAIARLDSFRKYVVKVGMMDYLLSDPVARLHFLIAPLHLNGMENFGLLNVKEALWPKDNDTASFYPFAKTLFHEMTHQWFGNLVTVEWWDDIWLSESITTFLSSPRPIVFDPVHDLSTEPLVSFTWTSSIPFFTYTKGSAILEMLDALIGPLQMRRLLRNYLRTFEFGAASTGHFFELLQKILGVQGEGISQSSRILEFLEVWLYQGSHPIVFIDYDPPFNQVCFSQAPKMGLGNASWPIPIWIECLEETVEEKLFWIPMGGQLVLNLDEITKTNRSRALSFNRNRAVYYQVSIRY